jgi:hypothetical protein
MVVAILTRHARVRTHLHTCRFCKEKDETVQHIICCCEALAHQRFNVFGYLVVEPTDIHTASVRDLCLLIRGKRLRNLGSIQYLGLHNKPMAVVLPGAFMLTGPRGGGGGGEEATK